MISGFTHKVLYRSGVAVIVYCAVNCLFDHVAELLVVTGPSMRPAFNTKGDGDLVVVEHISSQFKRGDVVVARSPTDPNDLICKRIAAMSGDFIRTGPDGQDGIKIPKGYVWLLGDNSSDSRDSRDYGPVPSGLIRGRACFKVWPLTEFGRIRNSFEDKWT